MVVAEKLPADTSSTQVKVDGPKRYNGPVTGPFSIHQYIYISKKKMIPMSSAGFIPCDLSIHTH